MKLAREDFERARDELLQEVAGRPKARLLERLARAHRFLGEEDEAVRRFREAAADVQRVLERQGREDTYRIALVAALLHLAGDDDAARPWVERALRTERDPGRIAALAYMTGDDDAAAREARRASEDPDDRPYPWAEALEALAVARRDRDPDRASRARETFAELLRADGTPPYDESGAADLSLSDWLLEAARVEAGLEGGPPPDPAEVLLDV